MTPDNLRRRDLAELNLTDEQLNDIAEVEYIRDKLDELRSAISDLVTRRLELWKRLWKKGKGLRLNELARLSDVEGNYVGREVRK